MSTKIPMFERMCALQCINVEWRNHLSSTERDLINYLATNSVGYGRPAIRLSLDQMAMGSINKRTGEMWLVPSGLSRSTLLRTIAALREKGALIVQAGTGRKPAQYIVNIEWDYPMKDKLPISKKQRERMAVSADLHPGAENDARSGVNLTPLGVRSGVNLTPLVYIEEESYNRTIVGRACPTGLLGEEVKDDAVALIRQIQTKGKKETKAQQETHVARQWRKAHVDAGLGIPPLLDKKGRGQLALARGRLGDNGEAFLAWSLASWRKIIAENFDWMTKSSPPSRPDPAFLLRHANTFIEAYGVHTRSEEDGGTPDEKEIRKLVETGSTPEEALIEMGRRKALGDERGSLARERSLLNAEFKALQGEKEHLRRRDSLRPVKAPQPPVVLRHGDNPWDKDTPVVIQTDFGSFDDDSI